jgi:hypothetical protein
MIILANTRGTNITSGFIDTFWTFTMFLICGYLDRMQHFGVTIFCECSDLFSELPKSQVDITRKWY